MSVCTLWTVVALLAAVTCAQEENSVEESYDTPPPLYPGDVEIFRSVPCPNGLYEDSDRQASSNTKICVEARLNCKIGVTWQSMCNSCTCAKGAKKLPSIECSQEDCYGFQLPEEDLGNSNLCGSEVYDCPRECGFVRRTATCVYCQCSDTEPANQEPAPAELANQEPAPAEAANQEPAPADPANQEPAPAESEAM